jgi:hypothetical protein
LIRDGRILSINHETAAAERAHAADAALRPQDRRYFEGWSRPAAFPIYRAARLMRNPLDGNQSYSMLEHG